MIYNRDTHLEDEDDNELWDNELDMPDSTESPEEPFGPSSDPRPVHYDDYENDGEDYYTGDNTTGNNRDSDGYEDKGRYDDYPDDHDYYSDDTSGTNLKPEPVTRLSRQDHDDNDFYNDDDLDPAPVARKGKAPKLDPEDPDYWIEEESGISIIHKPRKTLFWWIGGIVVLIAIICGVWLWWFRPYVDDAVKYGYIKQIERSGSLIKTFEGVLIPYRELGDPTPFYFEQIRFSVESDSVAAKIKRMMLNCTPVRLEYKLYHSPILWKGEETMVIVAADSADVNKILPPDYR